MHNPGQWGIVALNGEGDGPEQALTAFFECLESRRRQFARGTDGRAAEGWYLRREPRTTRTCPGYWRMKISKKVKVALDETRMLVLGAQILIGFQFRGVFQNLYEPTALVSVFKRDRFAAHDLDRGTFDPSRPVPSHRGRR
jgi:hypothetical protein